MKNVRFSVHKVCEYCGKEFVAKKVSTRFCCSSCARKYHRTEREHRRLSLQLSEPATVQYGPPREYMRLQEAADYLSVNRTTIYRLIRSGKLPYTHINGVSIISRETVRELVHGYQRTGIMPKPAVVLPKHEVNPCLEASHQQDYISITEAAELYGIPRMTVSNYLLKGSFQSITVGRVKFFLKKDVDEFFIRKRKAMHPEVTDWYSIDDIMEKFNMTRSGAYNFVNSRREKIVKKKEGNSVFYAMKDIDRLCRKKDINMDDYYTADRAAELLGVNINRLYKALRRYRIPKRNIRGKLYIPKAEFDKFVESSRIDVL